MGARLWIRAASADRVSTCRPVAHASRRGCAAAPGPRRSASTWPAESSAARESERSSEASTSRPTPIRLWRTCSAPTRPCCRPRPPSTPSRPCRCGGYRSVRHPVPVRHHGRLPVEAIDRTSTSGGGAPRSVGCRRGAGRRARCGQDRARAAAAGDGRGLAGAGQAGDSGRGPRRTGRCHRPSLPARPACRRPRTHARRVAAGISAPPRPGAGRSAGTGVQRRARRRVVLHRTGRPLPAQVERRRRVRRRPAPHGRQGLRPRSRAVRAAGRRRCAGHPGLQGPSAAPPRGRGSPFTGHWCHGATEDRLLSSERSGARSSAEPPSTGAQGLVPGPARDLQAPVERFSFRGAVVG